MAGANIATCACALAAAMLTATACPLSPQAATVQESAFAWASATRACLMNDGVPDWAGSTKDSNLMVNAVTKALWDSDLPQRLLHTVEVFAGSSKITKCVYDKKFNAIAFEKDLSDMMDARCLSGMCVLYGREYPVR